MSICTRVLEVRSCKNGSRRRRHFCKNCGHRWTIYDGEKPTRRNDAKPRKVKMTCYTCIHWMQGKGCSFGFPDPKAEGIGFARECHLYAAA